MKSLQWYGATRQNSRRMKTSFEEGNNNNLKMITNTKTCSGQYSTLRQCGLYFKE